MIKGGLKLDTPISGKDYILGGFSLVPFESLQPDNNWTDYLPVREYQNLNNIEPFACVTFTILNCIEILIKRKYGIEVNYADRFLAFVSGTKDQQGNSPKTVCEFLRKIGVPPEELWTFDSTVDTYEKFYSPPPPKLYELAREFNEKWDFKYEFVPSDHESISKALQCSPLLISFSAWFENNGIYFRPEGMTDNHATTLFYERKNEFRRVFDSYQPVIKDLRWEDVPMQIMRFWVQKKEEVIIKKNFLQIITEWIISLFK
jgi:hypothetical protein